MKFSAVAVLLLSGYTTSAFNNPLKLHSPRTAFVSSSSARIIVSGDDAARSSCLFMSTTEEETDVAESAMPTIYDTLGFKQEDMGRGIDPEELLEWLGTREQIIAKFLKDNKNFDRERSEKEVDKFIKDTEMVGKYIAFEKKKKADMADPDYQRRSREENLADPSVIALYAAWIIGGAGIAYFKNVIAAPKYASGEWSDIHIPLPQLPVLDAMGGAGSAAVDAAVSSPAVEAVSGAADAIAQSM
mmetsp:Transcript_49216/g.73187  ORF Transcript_49216/g.73187 Transcript_49216/m.73187 type:complete len:244 (+) Transcript_49216:84-815(+)|eukprot:CAMPEP_0195518246 /NCGR_PEP_ID=MMETSP0794_2-20130614/12638_1 /TAXON_ID=515487 /ORGANISM="Stephanopyxis turris, Strain CCMP 815" /LENGTH=243 /DNA_ID=CAMNT_0040647185 /DNA_START=84 /DNA_END=815 /DNA_ORIENTATION=-